MALNPADWGKIRVIRVIRGDQSSMKHERLTGEIPGAAMAVLNELGSESLPAPGKDLEEPRIPGLRRDSAAAEAPERRTAGRPRGYSARSRSAHVPPRPMGWTAARRANESVRRASPLPVVRYVLPPSPARSTGAGSGPWLPVRPAAAAVAVAPSCATRGFGEAPGKKAAVLVIRAAASRSGRGGSQPSPGSRFRRCRSPAPTRTP